MLATRTSDGRTLAIEHTLIEPFAGEGDDFHKHFKFLQENLRADGSLRVPGFALYLHLPVGALPHKSDWQGITGDVAQWLRAQHSSFPAELSYRPRPCPHHPSRVLVVLVKSVPLHDPSRSFLIVQRYGEMRVDDAVEKALRRKLRSSLRRRPIVGC